MSQRLNESTVARCTYLRQGSLCGRPVQHRLDLCPLCRTVEDLTQRRQQAHAQQQGPRGVTT